MAKFWWVNQGRSYARELDLGIAWAPMLTDKGRKQHHWERMDLVQRGDIVVHDAEGQSRAISRVLVGSHSACNPHSGDDWGQAGRELKLAYEVLDVALTLDSLPKDLRQVHAVYGSPFDRFGSVNLGYFFDLPNEIGIWIMDEVGLVAKPGDALVDSPPGGEEQNYETVIVVGPDGEVTVKTRAEHHQLKKHLFKGKLQSECAMCGRTLPLNLLVTAHIKQRSKCSKAERVDPHVVMAACVLGCDALFEKGFISVGPDGFLAAGPRSATAPALVEHVNGLVGNQVPIFGPSNSKYFAWHKGTHAK